MAAWSGGITADGSARPNVVSLQKARTEIVIEPVVRAAANGSRKGCIGCAAISVPEPAKKGVHVEVSFVDASTEARPSQIRLYPSLVEFKPKVGFGRQMG